MAPRRPSYTPPPTTVLTPQEMRVAMERLGQRVEELKKFDVKAVRAGTDPPVASLAAAIESTVARIYGPESHQYRRLGEAWALDTTTYWASFDGGGGPSVSEIQDGVEKGRQRSIALLQQAIATLGEELKYAEPGEAAGAATGIMEEKKPTTSEVFVVHGHDDAARLEVSRVLSKAGLTPVVLHEQANKGMTVIEKLEYHSNVGFAVVIMTPDDIGGPAGGGSQPRARQNVVAELFYFMGKLGRDRVCALKMGELEIPSDIGGVVYVPLDAGGGWKQALLRELDAAGYHPDWREALK